MGMCNAHALIGSMEQSNMGIKLTDSSLTEPLGEVKDIPLDFGGYIVSADFYVVVIQDPEDLSLLLGRTFLATVGVIMDCRSRRVLLAYVEKDTF
ncbi:unnamed protein product [Microthlaspi erraticum]|uniref:Uncharacterized protein n=1 Tax=Microthlaspi erraticum TaxID=1685480 RepID=A0A6D2KQE7_9BRAS|nr:unnamed protein product [Microthlaspi erraticum]CAA7056827.1 unnamed protein product [Microthlaspi erraticum]